ncbi:hypothetical protein [Gulbenkiania mobilis]|uniref:hypothetical protein n=1 Tax=Gulbenkiania mobilis TaxID=397457 RepID=UPI0006BBDD83|nr:hypothetical protein [Gulbenkiania mobilis]
MRLIFIAVLLAAANTTPAAATDAGACYVITDQDARTYCLAKAHQDPGRCYGIRAPDTRARCLAEVRR